MVKFRRMFEFLIACHYLTLVICCATKYSPPPPQKEILIEKDVYAAAEYDLHQPSVFENPRSDVFVHARGILILHCYF
jgi:hypothetical protein